MVKFRLYFDKEKEMRWLNEMSKQGWAMTGFFAGLFTFEQCEKGKYAYQVDFGNKFFSVSQDYRAFMSEAGIDIVQIWGFWVVLRRHAASGEFQLYTDVESQLAYYKKVLILFKAVTIVELIGLFIVLFSAVQTGVPFAWGSVFLLLGFVVVLMKATFHTKDIVCELNERKTGLQQPRNAKVSIFLPVGFILNCCALLVGDSIPSSLKISIQILAGIFMLVGIYKTARKRR